MYMYMKVALKVYMHVHVHESGIKSAAIFPPQLSSFRQFTMTWSLIPECWT